MKKLVFIALMTIFLNGQNSAYAFYQEQEIIQIEETKQLTEKEQKTRRKNEKNPNSEVLQIQPKGEELEVQPIQEQKTKAIDNRKIYSDKKQANTSSANIEKKTPENDQQENNVSKDNEQSSKSFPTWGWFVIIGVIGVIVLIYMVFRYKKFLYLKYNYNIFSISTILCLLLLFGTILFLFGQIGQNETGEMWGISIKTFIYLLITAIILTVGILYYYNLKKTNWYFAIFNVAIQAIVVGGFVIIAIGWVFWKIFTSSDSADRTTGTQSSTTGTQSNSSVSRIAVAIQKGKQVVVYNEKNRQIFIKYGELYGFTDSTVSIKDNSRHIRVYDIKGRQISSHSL
jgi:hypothetical protein